MVYFNNKPVIMAGGNKAGPLKLDHEADGTKVFGAGAQGQDPTPVATSPATPQPSASAPNPAAPTPQPTQPQAAPTAQAKPVPVQMPAPVLKQAPAPAPAQPAAPAPQPSAAPNTSGMANTLWEKAMQTMNNPSRYDADLVKQGASVIEDTINRMRQSGMRGISETMAARGLTGSSLEANDMSNLEAQLQEQGRAGLFNLQREQANTYGADRNSALGFGLGVGGFGESINNRLGNEDFRNRSLAQDRYFGDRSNDRADLSLAGNFASIFGPEAVERAGISGSGVAPSPTFGTKPTADVTPGYFGGGAPMADVPASGGYSQPEVASPSYFGADPYGTSGIDPNDPYFNKTYFGLE